MMQTFWCTCLSKLDDKWPSYGHPKIGQKWLCGHFCYQLAILATFFRHTKCLNGMCLLCYQKGNRRCYQSTDIVHARFGRQSRHVSSLHIIQNFGRTFWFDILVSQHARLTDHAHMCHNVMITSSATVMFVKCP